MKYKRCLKELNADSVYFILTYGVLSTLWFGYFSGLLSGTCISGGDWAYPCFEAQLDGFLASAFSSWNFTSNFYGEPSISNVASMPLTLLLYALASLFGVKYYVFSFLYIIISLLLIGLLRLCIELKLPLCIAYLSSSFVLLSPTFLNYFLMGWLGVLFLISLLPLYLYYFLRYLSTDRNYYLLTGALLFSICIVQSQGVFFLTSVLIGAIILGIYERKLRSILLFFCTNFICFIALNLHWLSILLSTNVSESAQSNVLYSDVSLGADARLSAWNLLLGKGSLYNSQIETIVNNNSSELGYVLVFSICIIGLLVSSKKTKIILLGVYLLVPAIIFLNDNRFLLTYIPFGHSIRHLARFLSVLTIVQSIFFSIGVLYLFNVNKKPLSAILKLYTAAVTFFLLYPLLSFSLQDWKLQTGPDFRLRHNNIPSADLNIIRDYQDTQNGNFRTLILPSNGFLQSRISNSFRINGFSTFIDRDAKYIFPAGNLTKSDKSVSIDVWPLMSVTTEKTSEDTILNHLMRSDIRFVVVRKNLHNMSDFVHLRISEELDDELVVEIYQDENLIVYENKEYRHTLNIKTLECNDLTFRISRLSYTSFLAIPRQPLLSNLHKECQIEMALNDSSHNGWTAYALDGKYEVARRHLNHAANIDFEISYSAQKNFLEDFFIQRMLTEADAKKILSKSKNYWVYKPNKCEKKTCTEQKVPHFIVTFEPQRTLMVGLSISICFFILLCYFIRRESKRL